jgi:RNA polymerase sigma-70 factor (ECF subfamily)
MPERDQRLCFEQLILPHLDAAYNLARWLTHNDQDAQDMVQDACLRAFRFLPGFRGSNSRVWLLTIVRNTCYTWLQQRRQDELTTPFDEEIHDIESDALNPEVLHLKRIEHDKIKESLESLPVEYREVIVLRELEGLSYKDISAIVHVPLGTVMSRLARARRQLQGYLATQMNDEGTQ